MSKTELKHIKLSEIYEPSDGLRKVDRTNENYLGLVESIRSRGVMNPINVREIKDETGNIIYGLVDGLQRFTASKDAGKEEIPCHVISVEDGELLEAQIIANVHKVETKPVEYSKGLEKIINSNPLLTRAELADKLSKTTAWLSERLGLLKLIDQVGALVDSEDISLSNAYVLAKLPPDEQSDFVDRAMSMSPQEFTPTVHARIKELRDAKRQGRDANKAEFQPIAVLRGRSEILSELENKGNIKSLLEGISTPEDAFKRALEWTLNLDPASVQLQKEKDDERKANRQRQKEKAELERKKKRAQEVAEKAELLKAELEEAGK